MWNSSFYMPKIASGMCICKGSYISICICQCIPKMADRYKQVPWSSIEQHLVSRQPLDGATFKTGSAHVHPVERNSQFKQIDCEWVASQLTSGIHSTKGLESRSAGIKRTGSNGWNASIGALLSLADVERSGKTPTIHMLNFSFFRVVVGLLKRHRSYFRSNQNAISLSVCLSSSLTINDTGDQAKRVDGNLPIRWCFEYSGKAGW